MVNMKTLRRILIAFDKRDAHDRYYQTQQALQRMQQRMTALEMNMTQSFKQVWKTRLLREFASCASSLLKFTVVKNNEDYLGSCVRLCVIRKGNLSRSE